MVFLIGKIIRKNKNILKILNIKLIYLKKYNIYRIKKIYFNFKNIRNEININDILIFKIKINYFKIIKIIKNERYYI